MAVKLPTREQLGRRPIPSGQGAVVPLHLSTPRVGPEFAATAQLGQAATQLGNTFQALLEKEKQKNDEARTEEAYSDYLNGLLDLELNEETGFAQLKSGAAVKDGLPETYTKRREELAKGIAEQLANPEQNEGFTNRTTIADRQFDSRVYRHVATQSQIYRDQVFDGIITTERQQAALLWEQPGQVELSLLRITEAVTQKARHAGLNPEIPDDKQAIDSMLRIAETQVHGDVIEIMLQRGQDIAAKTYFDAVKENLTPDALITLGGKVDIATTDGEIQRGVDLVWAGMGPKAPNEPVLLADMEKQLRSQYKDNPALIDDAVQELRSRATAHNDTQRELQADNKSKLLSAYHEGADLATLQTMPEYWAMDGIDRVAVKDFVQSHGYTDQQRARAENTYQEGEKARTGYSTYWSLMTNPVELSGMSDSQIAALELTVGSELKNNLLAQKQKLLAPANVREASIDNELFNTFAADAGLEPFAVKQTEVKKEYLGRLRNRVETVIARDQTIKGAELTRKEKQDIMQSEIDRKVMVDTWGRDKQIPAAAITLEQRENIYIPMDDIPTVWIMNAVHYLRSEGVVPTAWSDEKAMKRLKDRLQRAYAISVAGGTADEGRRILLDRPQ